MYWYYLFFIFQSIFFSFCLSTSLIDIFLKNQDCVSTQYFYDFVYCNKNEQVNCQWFDQHFPALFQKDKIEAANDKSNDRLIIRLFKLIYELLKEPYGLSWCSCNQAPISLRIQLAFEVFDCVIRKFPNTDQRLVYTSYASGKLLQDIVVIAGLIELGYKNVTINLIDLVYDRSRRSAIGLYAPVLFRKFIRNLIEKKYSKQALDILYYDVVTYGDVYDYIQDIQLGVAFKSNIILLVDPGSDLLYEEFEYFGTLSRASLILFDFAKKDSSIALYIPRNKKIYYFYAKNIDSEARDKISKIILLSKSISGKNNFLNILIQEMKRGIDIKNIIYFQSPFRSFEDLKYDGSVEDPIIFQLCDGVIFHDVRDGFPIRNYTKVWF